MATVNKSDRKKLISTEVYGAIVVFMRADTGEEFARLDTADLADDMMEALQTYGAKQIVADVVSAADGIEEKIAGMVKACDQLRAGAWPRRERKASIEPAIAMLMAAQGITRDAALTLLGM